MISFEAQIPDLLYQALNDFLDLPENHHLSRDKAIERAIALYLLQNTDLPGIAAERRYLDATIAA